MSCYRSQFDLGKQLMVESDNELTNSDNEDKEYYPEIPKVKGKTRKLYIKEKKSKRELINDEKFKIVKDQCGKHSLWSACSK